MKWTRESQAQTRDGTARAAAVVPHAVPTGQHAGPTGNVDGSHRSPDAPRELDGDVVPDVLRPPLEHARAGHDVQAVSRRVRVRPEERWPVDGQEMDVGVLPRVQYRL